MVAYFDPKKYSKIFLKKLKVEKTTLKSCSEIIKKIFTLAAQTEEFMFQNVALDQLYIKLGLVHIRLV